MQLTSPAIHILPAVCSRSRTSAVWAGDSVRSGKGWEDWKFVIHVSKQAAKHLVFMKHLLGKHMPMLTDSKIGKGAILKTQ